MTNPRCYNPIMLPQGGELVGRISFSAGPGEFYIQLTESLGRLGDLMSDLKTKYQHAPPINTMPQIGDAIVAKYPEDNEPYRGVVLGMTRRENSPDIYVQVFFCDYGNVDEVHISQVHQALPKYLQVPQMAFEASIDLRRSSSEFSEQEANAFAAQVPIETDTKFKVLVVEGNMSRMRYQVGFIQQGRPEPEVAAPSLVSPKYPQRTLPSDAHGQGAALQAQQPQRTSRPNIFSLATPNLIIGNEYQVSVVSLTSFNSFGVQLKVNEKNFKLLQQKMISFYTAKLAELKVGSPPLQSGDLCAAFIQEEGEWARCVVISISPMTNLVSLENIDFGETLEVPQSSLCELATDFVKGVSAELVKCDLHDVEYDASKHKNAPLTEALIEELNQQFQSICTLPTTSITIVRESGSNVQSRRYSVHLKATNERNQAVNVNNHMKVLLNQMISKQQQSASAVPPAGVTPSSGPRSSNSPQTTSFQQSRDLPPLKLPPIGEMMPGQIVYGTGPGDLHLVLSQCQEDLDNIVKRMSALYGTCKRDGTYTLDKVIPGLICAALFDADQSWYRAKVISQVGSSSYSVLFVDYGNVESVALVNMRKLDGSLFQYAALAVPVQIEELKALAENWGQVEQEFFDDKVIEEQFTVKFNVSNSNRASVSLFDANGDDMVDVIKRAIAPSPGKSRPETKRPDQMQMGAPPKPGFDARDVINANRSAAGRQFGGPGPGPTSPQGASGGGFDRNRLGKPPGQGDREPRFQMSNGMQRSNFSTSDERKKNGAIGFDQKPDRNSGERFQQNAFNKGGSFGNQRGDSDSQGFKSGGRNFEDRNFNSREASGSFGDQRGNRNEPFGQSDRPNRGFSDRNEKSDQRGFGGRDERGFGNRENKGFGEHDDRGFGNRENKGFGNREERGFGNRGDQGSGIREERGSGSRLERNFSDRSKRNFGGGDNSGFGGQGDSGFQNRRDGSGGGGFGKRDEGSFQGKTDDNFGNRNEGDRGFGGNKDSRGPRRSNDSDSFPSNAPEKTRREQRASNSSSEQSVFSSGASKSHSNQPSSSSAAVVPNTGESFTLQDYDKFLPTEPVVCRVCNFESPSSFFVVIIEEVNKMNELVKQYLSTPQDVKRPQKVETKFCYLLPTGQTSGRRAEVVSILENVERCALFCCDIGSNKTDVSMKQLLSLDANLAATCKLVIKSRLHGLIGPVTIADQEGEWTLSAFNKFKELTEKKEVKVAFKGRDSDNIVTVDIILQDDQLMSQLFLEKSFAVVKKEDDELENANHYATFLGEDEHSMWLQGQISQNQDLTSKLLCLETSHIWIAHADRDKLLKNLQDQLKTTFDQYGADKLLIKKPLLNSCYTATLKNQGIHRCRVEKIDDESDSYVVRFIDFGTCQRVDSIHLMPSFAAKVPYLAKRVPINPDLEKLISPFVMFELSRSDSFEVKLRQNESKEFAEISLNDKDLGDEILKLASKMHVDNRSFDCHQVQLRVTEVPEVEIGNCFNAVVVETESQSAENAALQKELDSFYESSNSETILPTLMETNPLLPEDYDLTVGSFVVFKTENICQYCRGEIVEIGTDTSLTVRSIDYATTQTVPKENIRKIVSKFCEKAAISVQCSTTTHTSEELEEMIGQEVEASLLHLGRINIVSIQKEEPETEELLDPDFIYPSTHSIDLSKQPLTMSDFSSPVEMSYFLSRFDSEISNIGEEVQMIWEEQENITEENLAKDLVMGCEVDNVFYRALYDSQQSELHMIDFGKRLQKPLTEISLKKLPNFLQALPALGQNLQISSLIPVEDESFADIERQIAKYDVGNHFCSFEDNSGSDFLFGTKLYSKYLVDDKIARTEDTEEFTGIKYKTDLFEIDADESGDVVVSAVDRKNIWVQVSLTEEAVQELQTKLSEKFNEEYLKRPHSKLRRPKIGKACATKFAEDDCWYRAEVIQPDEIQKVDLENDFVFVRFVDFGNTQKTESSALYSLPEELVESPKYALKVAVPNMEGLMNFDLEKHLNKNLVSQKVKLFDITLKDEILTADVEFGGQNLIEVLKFVKSNPKVVSQNMTNVKSINANITFVCEDGSLYVQNSEAIHQLDELMEKLKATYSNLEEEELQLEEIEVGEFLVVKSPEDEEIYRAKLLDRRESEGSEVFEVLLIDYGNSLECPIDVCWKVSRDLASQPPHAYHCAIFDCDFNEEKLEEVCEFLSQMLESENAVECEFQVRIDPLMVDIKFQENWITETLAEKELLKEATLLCDMKYLDAETVTAEGTKCLFVSAKDPKHFVLQLSGEVNDRLTLLQEDLNHYYLEQEVESLDPNELTEGCAVVGFDAEYESNCRAIVEKIDTENETCQLRFVDWGRTCEVAFKDLKPLRHSFLKALRPQGIQVALNGVLPDEDDEYLGSDQAVIEEIIGEDELTVTKVGESENNSVSLVLIKLSSDESCLKQRLIEAEICRDSSSAPLEWPTISKSFYDMDVGSKVVVNVASVDKEGLYVQLETHLETLENLLANYETEKKLLRRPKVGKLCVSKFAEDGLYYRAEILKIEAGFAEILFVDYRNEENCKLEELYEMSKELVAIPGCCLRTLFKPEVSELINFDVLQSLCATMTMTAENPKNCEIEVLQLVEESLLVEVTFDGNSLIQEIDRIRAHPVVTWSTMKNCEEIGFLLSNFENVSSLFLIKEESISKREEFNKKMTSFYNRLRNSEELKIEKREFVVGAHVAVKIIPDANPLESSWSRASVESVSEDGSFKLRLLDTGACIQKNNLELCRKLTEEFAKDRETFAVRCKLYQILNKPDCDVAQKVVELIKAVDHVPFSVIVVSRTSVPQAIDIYVDDEKTLTEVLIGEDLVNSAVLCQEYKRHEEPEIGSSLEVSYTDSSSPEDIRYQLVSAHEILAVLEEDIRRSVEFAADVEGVTAPKVCLAQSSEDQLWYRGLVKEISAEDQESQNHIEVMFVDWGNSEWVSIESIKEIASEFCELPAQSISCTVTGIVPIEGSQWVEDDNEVLSEILTQAERIEVEIQEFVETHVTGDCNVDGSSLVALLIENKVAKDPESTQEPDFERICWSKFDLEAGSEVSIWVSAVEPVNISWSLEAGREGKVVKGNWRDASHLKCDKFDKNFVWIQLDSNDDDLNQMNEYISKHANSYKRLRRVRPGRMGTIKSGVLQCWIRVQVLSVEENEGTKSGLVRAVDYGHTEKVADLNDLKELPKSLWKKHCFCLSVALEDLEIENLNIDTLEDLGTNLVFNENETVTLKVTSVSTDPDCPIVFGTLAFREASLRSFIDSLNEKTEILPKNVPCVETGSPPASYFISHFEDPQNIYLQLASEYESMDTLLREMNEFYNSLEDGRLLAGDFSQKDFVSFCEDNQWKRGMVEKVESQMTQIRDVDTGKLHSFQDLSVIRKLKSSFATKPMFSFCASLFALNPASADGWNNSACQDIVHSNIPASGEVIAEMFSDGKNVILKLDGKDLALQLIEEELAAPYEITSDKVTTNSSVKENITLPCVLVDVETPNKVLFQVAETNEELIILEQDLFSFYENGNGKTMVFGADENLVEKTCVIKSLQDDSWHRGIVKTCDPGTEGDSEEQCEVFLVDWGSSETLPRSQIFPTLKDFVCKLQSQAVIANLVSIVPDEVDEDWVFPDDVDNLKTLLGDQETYNVKIGLFDEEKQVALADVILEDGQSLCNKAVDAGFSRFTESESKTIPTFKTLEKPFSEGQWVECKLWVIDAEKIVVSPVGMEEEADNLLEKMNELIANNEIVLKKLRRVKLGRNCIAVHSDEMYYRAEISKVDEENSDQIEVFLVDFGEFSTVPRNKCFEVNSTDSSILDLEKCTIAIKQVLSATEFTEAIESEICDCLSLETTKLIVKIADRDGTEPLAGEVKINNDFLSEFVLAISTPNIMLPSKEYPEVGSKVMAAISYHTSDCFYIQMQDDVDAIETIQAGLQAKYNNSSEVAKFRLDQDLLQIGSIVACKCSEDSNWYRAEISHLKEKSKYKVKMIDYGFTDQVIFGNLCRLDRKFHSEPPFAVRCVLNGVSFKVEDGYQSDEVLEVMQYDNEAEYYEMEVKDVSSDGMVEVSYNYQDGKSIADVLVEQDLAKNRENEAECENQPEDVVEEEE